MGWWLPKLDAEILLPTQPQYIRLSLAETRKYIKKAQRLDKSCICIYDIPILIENQQNLVVSWGTAVVSWVRGNDIPDLKSYLMLKSLFDECFAGDNAIFLQQ